MMDDLRYLYQSLGLRDLIEIAVLAVVIYAVLRFLGTIRGAGTVRSLVIVVATLFLLAQVVIVSFDLRELSRTLDYFLIAALLGLLIVLQPEFRQGLFALGHHPIFQTLGGTSKPLAETLGQALEALSRESTGALIAIQREVTLTRYIKSGESLDSKVSANLLLAIFNKYSPLHDGAVILRDGRIAAAGCQLPLAEAPPGSSYGMRHRAALGLSEDTDALLLVVSEETGAISIGEGGRLETVSGKELVRRLAQIENSADSAEAETIDVPAARHRASGPAPRR